MNMGLSKVISMLSPNNLHVYQHRAIDHIKDNKKCGLFIGMGLGKTISTLTALGMLGQKTILIIAPLQVAKNVWLQEAQKWEHTQDMKFNLLAGLSPTKRLEALKHIHQKITIINVELLTWLLDNIEGWPFEVVVIDELSMFKDPKTQRFKRLKQVINLADRVIGLTATPAPNSLLNLWSEVFLLDKGERLEKHFGKYKMLYFIPDYMGYSWELRQGADKIIYDKISDICISMRGEDYLELPQVKYNDILLTLPAAARASYIELKRETIMFMKDKVVTAVNAAVLMGKLVQISSGTCYSEEGETINLHNVKLDKLKELVEELQGNPTLVTYKYIADKKKIKKIFPDIQEISQKNIIRWNNGEIPLMLISPKSASHGLNLQDGGHDIIEYTPDWSYETTDQLYGRLARQGQKHKFVTVHRLICQGTVDNVVIERLRAKEAGQNALIDAVKAIIDEE